ncbi:YdbH domain-containing protein [Neisseriaceae bacterium JH1-16]|nr:YdbH domain-containing protein [Neisseriaceae bacterium JH1-16]
MNMGFRLAFMRRYRWLIMLALLPLGVALAVVATAYVLGLRVQGVGWQNGLELTQWYRLQNGCVSVIGGRMRLTDWHPVTIRMASMRLPKCVTGTKELTPPPWTPPFDLSIDAVVIPDLPPMAVTVHQRDQRWQARASYRRSKATAVYDRLTGRWVAQGRIQGADIVSKLLGTLDFTGQGMWQTNRLDGALTAQGHQLGYLGQPQRSDATLSAKLAAKQWRLNAALASPMALGGGWILEGRPALQAGGGLDGVQLLRLDLHAKGPQGRAQLTLNTQGSGVARGQGRLTLTGPELAGTVPLTWTRQTLSLQPAALSLPQGLRLSWPNPVVLPLALAGESTISAELQYQGVRVKTVDSLLSWQQARWGWQGRLDLTGNAAGYKLAGGWQGRVDTDGLSGEPASLTVSGSALTVTLRLPVAEFRAPGWNTQAQFSGHYRNYPIDGVLDAGYTRGRWQGSLEGRSRLPFYAQGGSLTVTAPWYGNAGQWFLGSGSRVTITEGLIETVLVKPIAVMVSTPVRLSAQGVFGAIRVDAGGAVATRWAVPGIAGQLFVSGRQGQASLRLPAWRSELALTGALLSRGRRTGAQGELTVSTPLFAAMSNGFGITLQKGMLTGQARWQWQDHWQLQGEMAVSDLALNWGGILASGGQGAAHIELTQTGLLLTSTGPFRLAELGVGTPMRNVRMAVQSDLSRWHFIDVYAEVLGGTMSAPALQWPSAQYQPVTVSHIDLAEVAALQNDPNPTVQLAGRVGGQLPLQLMKDSLAVQGGLIRNEGPVSLKVFPSAGVSAMGQSNRAVQLALDTLSNLEIHDLQARLAMQPDGWLDAAVTIKGQSPQQNRLPVVLNYTHRENVLELLRSLRIGDEIARGVMDRRPADGPR